MKMKFEIEGCNYCPCLRNNQYGEYTCFFNDGRILDAYDLNKIDEYCPIKEAAVNN